MKRFSGLAGGFLAGVVVLVWSATAQGQIGSGGSIGTSSGTGGVGTGSRIGGTSGTGTSGLSSMGLGTQGSTGLGGAGSIGGLTGRTGTGTVLSPSSTNPFYPSYQNPMALGLSTSTTSTVGSGSSTTGTGTGTTGSKSSTGKTSGSLGQPLYANISTGSGGQTGLTGGLGGLSGLGGLGGLGGTTSRGLGTSTNGSGAGFTTAGTRRNAPYATILDGDTIRIEPPVFQPAELQEILDRSTAIPRKGTEVNGVAIQGVTVEVKGTVVVLRGEVGTARERRLAEGMVRLTPGVREVDNQIVVMNQK